MDASPPAPERLANGEAALSAAAPARLSGSIYHLHPLVAGPLERWPAAFSRIQAMGFRTVCVAPPFAPGRSGDIFVHATFSRLHPALDCEAAADVALKRVITQAEQHGLRLLLDITPSQLAVDAPVRQQHPEWFDSSEQALPDPRRPPPRLDVATPADEWPDGLSDWWITQAVRLLESGVAGFRCCGLDRVPRRFWQALISTARATCPDAGFVAWTPGMPAEVLRAG